MELLTIILVIWLFGLLANFFFKVTWWVFKAIIGFIGFMFLLGLLAILF